MGAVFLANIVAQLLNTIGEINMAMPHFIKVDFFIRVFYANMHQHNFLGNPTLVVI